MGDELAFAVHVHTYVHTYMHTYPCMHAWVGRSRMHRYEAARGNGCPWGWEYVIPLGVAFPAPPGVEISAGWLAG